MYEKDLLSSGSAALPLPEPVEVPGEDTAVLPDQDADAVVPGSHSPAPTGSVEVSAGDAEASPGGYWIYVPGKDVSGSDLETVSSGDVPVSGGDAGGSRGSGVTVYYTEAVDSPDYSVQLEDIGGKLDTCVMLLTLVAGLLLFYWCHARVRNAVRSFTGRNAIDD